MYPFVLDGRSVNQGAACVPLHPSCTETATPSAPLGVPQQQPWPRRTTAADAPPPLPHLAATRCCYPLRPLQLRSSVCTLPPAHHRPKAVSEQTKQQRPSAPLGAPQQQPWALGHARPRQQTRAPAPSRRHPAPYRRYDLQSLPYRPRTTASGFGEQWFNFRWMSSIRQTRLRGRHPGA